MAFPLQREGRGQELYERDASLERCYATKHGTSGPLRHLPHIWPLTQVGVGVRFEVNESKCALFCVFAPEKHKNETIKWLAKDLFDYFCQNEYFM